MKPFDKVLVRNAEYGLWIPALFGMEKDGQYITSAGWQKYCIPYEGNENLIGTKIRRQKHIEVIGAKNVAINSNTNSLSITESSYNAAFLNVLMRK